MKNGPKLPSGQLESKNPLSHYVNDLLFLTTLRYTATPARYCNTSTNAARKLFAVGRISRRNGAIWGPAVVFLTTPRVRGRVLRATDTAAAFAGLLPIATTSADQRQAPRPSRQGTVQGARVRLCIPQGSCADRALIVAVRQAQLCGRGFLVRLQFVRLADVEGCSIPQPLNLVCDRLVALGVFTAGLFHIVLSGSVSDSQYMPTAYGAQGSL